MNFRKLHIAVVFFLLLLSAPFSIFAQEDVLIEPPLTWSINSIQIVWTVGQGATKTQQIKLIYSSDQINSKTTGLDRIKENHTSNGASSKSGVNVDSHVSLSANPLTLFGLTGTKVNASAYIDSEFNYNESNRMTNVRQWSESERNVKSKSYTSENEQNVQQTISDPRLVFTVEFLNHTRSQLEFDPNYANSIPVYIDSGFIGNAVPVGIKDALISIPVTREPIPVEFEMPLNDSRKLALFNKKPLISISKAKLTFRTSEGEPEIKGNIFTNSLILDESFTIAILSGNDVKEWKIRWIEDNPVTLEQALEAINKRTRRQSGNARITVFDIKDNHLASVCKIPFSNNNNPTWITELCVIEGDETHPNCNPDAYLSVIPQFGDRYVFQIVNLEVRQLLKESQAGVAAAQYNLGKRYYYGDGVPVDKDMAWGWIKKAIEQSYLPAKDFYFEQQVKGKFAGERKTFIVNGVEFAFRWCPAGTFSMGSPLGENGREKNETQHDVKLSSGFWIMETEVTQKQWKAVMGDNPSYFKGEDLPVEFVSWNDCQAFCRKCTELGLPVLLPTEAQWEYACRAGSTGSYAGNLNEMAWYSSNSDYKTHPVGEKEPNAWGLYDMHGNVWEWCRDWKADYPNGIVTDPVGPPNGSTRVDRGGGWSRNAQCCRSAYRDFFNPDTRGSYLGFRCVRSIISL